jgi:uncharacterized protein YqeY
MQGRPVKFPNSVKTNSDCLQSPLPDRTWAISTAVGRAACVIVPVHKTPMSLIERIQKDLTEAMKAKDELRLSVLRMVKSALKNKEIEKIRPLDEAEALQVLQTLLKQRKESVEMFNKGGRTDLAEKETREMAFIEAYLPAGASDADLDRAIEAAIAETGATSPKQMGAVVKSAKALLSGKTVDGKVLSDRVRARLERAGA